MKGRETELSLELLTWISTYVLIILAELGDKTQLAVLLITSNNPKKRWLIFFASAIALSLCVLVEVTAGVALARHIAPHMINKIAGVVFLTLGMAGFINNLNLFRHGENKDSLSTERVAEQIH